MRIQIMTIRFNDSTHLQNLIFRHTGQAQLHESVYCVILARRNEVYHLDFRNSIVQLFVHELSPQECTRIIDTLMQSDDIKEI